MVGRAEQFSSPFAKEALLRDQRAVKGNRIAHVIVSFVNSGHAVLRGPYVQ